MGVVRSIVVEASGVGMAPECADRLGDLVEAHFAYVWRLLRRLGLSEVDADDVAQQAFLVAARRLDDIQTGSERAFLYTAAVRTAYKHRRTHARRREETLDELPLDGNGEPCLEELLDRRKAREILDAIVETMPMGFRVVFVLYEIDGLSTSEIAEVVGIPAGTVASRLRRARADFEARVARLEARRKIHGGRS
jgi:RNA polymerase sigma-70 factor (ECF subfamily)